MTEFLWCVYKTLVCLEIFWFVWKILICRPIFVLSIKLWFIWKILVYLENFGWSGKLCYVWKTLFFCEKLWFIFKTLLCRKTLVSLKNSKVLKQTNKFFSFSSSLIGYLKKSFYSTSNYVYLVSIYLQTFIRKSCDETSFPFPFQFKLLVYGFIPSA